MSRRVLPVRATAPATMEAILALQKQHLEQSQQAVHADHIRQRQRDATIILALHYSHSSGKLFAGTHRGTIHVFHSSTMLPPPSDKAQPLPSFAAWPAHKGGVNCMDSTSERLVTGGDDVIHVWSLVTISLLGTAWQMLSPLQTITPAQYGLPSGALTAVPRTLSVLPLPSSTLLVSSHANQHVLVTDLHNSTTVADLTCSSLPPNASSSMPPSHSTLPILYLAEPYHVLLTGGADGYVRVYDCSSWQLISTHDVSDDTSGTRASDSPTRPAILALSTAFTGAATSAPPSSLIMCLTAAASLHAFYYPSLIALPPLQLPSPASLLHASLLFTAATVQRIHTEPLRVVEVKRCEDDRGGAITACCIRHGDRAAVDDVWFVGGGGGRIQMLGCMGSVDMGSLQCV